MADYPILAPTLGALGTTKNDPSDGEDAAKLGAVDRQTRNWIFDFMSLYVDSTTGKLKDTAFSSSSLPTGGIRGSTDNGGTQREILQGTVSDVDLRDGAVTTNKIATDAVTTTKIADANVTAAKLDTDSVTSTAIAANAVTEPKIADGAVTTNKIGAAAVGSTQLGTGAVGTTNIATNAVTGDKLPIGTGGQLLVHNGTTWVPTTITGALAISSGGVASISLSSASVVYVRVAESVAAGTAAGASSAASWTQKRGITALWSILEQTGGTTVSIGASGEIKVERNGVYLILVRVPAYSVGLHKLRVTYTPPSGGASNYEGSSECAPPGGTSESRLMFIQAVSGASAGSPGKFELFHYTELAKGTNGLGVPLGATDAERYAMVEMLLLSAA